ncbi:MAG: response regulator [Nitrospinae bacterium]|nr:response regulator [Nitrospinota bacterium]
MKTSSVSYQNGAAAENGVSANLRQDILREQILLAVGQIPMMQVSSYIVAVVLTIVSWNFVPHINTILWMILVTIVAMWRFYIFFSFKKVTDSIFDPYPWKKGFMLSTLISGIFWGASAFLLFPPNSIGLQSLLVLVMCSLAATTTVSHSSIKEVPMLWTFPAILQYSYRCFVEGGTFGHTISILSAFYVIVVFVYSIRVNRTITSSITLHFKNLDLIEELKQVTKLKDQYISIVSHDLRSPMIGVYQLMEHTLENIRKGENDDAPENLSMISTTLKSLVRLIDELLDISKLKTGKITAVKKTIHLKVIAEEKIMLIRPAADRKGISISNKIPEDMMIRADPVLYGGVLNNLLSNAMKFTHPGGQITLYAPEDRQSCIAVADNGKGISPQILPDIFKYEVKTTSIGTNGEKGSGLGLPFCMDIIKAHRGNVTVKSRFGEGTTFFVELPLFTKHILIVDDQEAHRRMMKDVIEKRIEADITEAEDGIEAMKEVAISLPDLIITDLQMPNMDGMKLIKSLREDDRFSKIPIIVATSSLPKPGHDNYNELKTAGVSDIVIKPVVEENFIPPIKRLL